MLDVIAFAVAAVIIGFFVVPVIIFFLVLVGAVIMIPISFIISLVVGLSGETLNTKQ